MATTGTDVGLGPAGENGPVTAQMRDFKEKGQREAESEGYGEGQPPYFLTAFIMFVKRDRRTGGPEGVSFQCANLDGALKKAREQMGVERVATMYDVVSACRDIVSQHERVSLGDEISSQIVRALKDQDAQAEQIIRGIVEQGKQGQFSVPPKKGG